MREIKKVGDIVMWCKSPYTIIKITDSNALLKQNFSIGTILTEMVPLSDISLLNQNKEDERRRNIYNEKDRDTLS